MDPNAASAIRDIFVILAAGVFSALCLTIIVLIIKLYRPIRDTVYNSSKTTENLRVITGNLVGVSEETANNIAQASRNAVSISENLKEGNEELPGGASSGAVSLLRLARSMLGGSRRSDDGGVQQEA